MKPVTALASCWKWALAAEGALFFGLHWAPPSAAKAHWAAGVEPSWPMARKSCAAAAREAVGPCAGSSEAPFMDE